jgi:hypothetical protein
MSDRPRITLGRYGWYPRSRVPRWRSAFRQWRRARPFWGGLWCLLGGALIAYFPAQAFKFLLVTSGNVVLGVAIGVVVAAMGLFLWFAPSQRHLAGLLAVLFSVVSLITSTFGGLLVGMILGTVGGALGFAWAPRRSESS